MPSTIQNTPASRITKMMRMVNRKDEKTMTNIQLVKALTPILPFQQDELVDMTREILLHSRAGEKKTGRVSKSLLKKLNAPVYIVAEEADYLFPGRYILKRAGKIFPHIEEMHLLSLGSHWGWFKDDAIGLLQERFNSMSAFLLRS
jgi:pimeloyl-ACP methyl ester carboxylesterase